MSKEITINPHIWAKAINILEEKNRQRRYINTCINAGICPICGSDLVEYEKMWGLTAYKCSKTSCDYKYPEK